MKIHQRPDAVVASLYDRKTGSFQYVISDPRSRMAAVIDPVLDFDEKAAATSTTNADRLLDYIAGERLDVAWVLDTHPHADHFSAAPYLAEKLGARTAIGEKVVEVQQLWKDIYGLDGFDADGSQWDRLFADGDSFDLGAIPVRVMLSPGHTLASVTYVAGSSAFVHDTLMMPDAGSSRADFPGGDAQQLYRSIRALLELPAETALFVGHDYGKDGREPACVATVAEHRAGNVHVRDGIDEAHYIALRERRDATLPLPTLMLYALQVNIRGGRLPEPDAEGRIYFRIPANRFEPPGAD